MERFETRLVGGVEPRRMRMAMLATLGALVSSFALLGPHLRYVSASELALAVLGTLGALALVRAIWRAVEGSRPVCVTPTAVTHAGVSIDRRPLEVERSQWIHGGRVGLVATLRSGTAVLSIGGLGIARDVGQSERRGRVFVDACVGDVVALERLLRAIGAPAPPVDAPYRAKGGSDERVLAAVVSAPPLAWWRGIVDLELALAILVGIAVAELELVVWLTWLAVTARKVMRTWRDEPVALPLHTLRTRGAGLVLASKTEILGETTDASRGARLGQCDGRACLELRLGAPTAVRLVSTSKVLGVEEMYSPDYDIGPDEFEWLVRFVHPVVTNDASADAHVDSDGRG